MSMNGYVGRAYLEDIEDSAGVEARLLVGDVQEGVLGALVGEESGADIELEALSDLVLELDGSAEGVGGGPGLGESEAVGLVRVLCLDVAVDG
jgi:hypothetical protein